MVAEARALALGLQLCHQLGVTGVIVELDSLVLVTVLRGGSSIPASLCSYVREIRRFSAMIVRFQHCFREANSVADSLANFGCSTARFQLFRSFSMLPRVVRGFCQLDRLGLGSFRCTVASG